MSLCLSIIQRFTDVEETQEHNFTFLSQEKHRHRTQDITFLKALLAQLINASVMSLQGLACALHLHLRALIIHKS